MKPIKLNAELSIETPEGGDIITLSRQIDLYKEYPMDIFKDLIGDGKATVVVQGEVANKTYGNGISLTCTVSLNCDQSQNAITAATELGAQLVNDSIDANVQGLWSVYEKHRRDG
mgnify:CR=1 FL=1